MIMFIIFFERELHPALMLHIDEILHKHSTICKHSSEIYNIKFNKFCDIWSYNFRFNE